jgi:hypothetical protein
MIVEISDISGGKHVSMTYYNVNGETFTLRVKQLPRQ